MRLLTGESFLVVLLAMRLIVGCADVAEPAEEPSNRVPLTCTSNITDTTSFLDWELTVDADPIRGGELFTATLDGAIVVPALNIDAAQILIAGGFEEVNVVDAKATVHVRSGALGADRILEIEPIPYLCFFGRNECHRANDLEGTPGLRGNTDCQPVSPTNPCGRFIRLDISTDCGPDGICDALGKTGPNSQCELNEFCLTQGIRVPLREISAQYFAYAEQDEVLFGWDDQNTGATRQEGGPNDGAWILVPAVYEQPTGPNGFRVVARGFPVAMDCTMGVGCNTCLSGTSSELAKPAPDSRLIAAPIQ
jgi:hypothetical protein